MKEEVERITLLVSNTASRWWVSMLLKKRGKTMVEIFNNDFIRMLPIDLKYLKLTLGRGGVSKQDTHLRKLISIQDSLVVTLRFLMN